MRLPLRPRRGPRGAVQAAALFALVSLARGASGADCVWLVSVDGLRPATIEELGEAELPNFARLRREAAWTHNARTDFDFTFTVPNHVSMVTARPVTGEDGHEYTFNGSPQPGDTLHQKKGFYVATLFDVAHDHGLNTAIFSGKSKLNIIDQSYGPETGAEDITGADNGRDKIDLHVLVETGHAAMLMDRFEQELAAETYRVAFLHLIDPDPAGHGNQWETEGYKDAVRRVDEYLGRLLDLIDESPDLRGRVTLVLTADHGGTGSVHGDQTLLLNYRIPFYVWGAQVPEETDLYALNPNSRKNPGEGRPSFADPGLPPIRNGDAANLILDLLDLPPVPGDGAIINAPQDLKAARVVSADAFHLLETFLSADGTALCLSWPSLGDGAVYALESSATGEEGSWEPVEGYDHLTHHLRVRLPIPPNAASALYRVRGQVSAE